MAGVSSRAPHLHQLSIGSSPCRWNEQKPLELYWKALDKVYHHLRPEDDPVEAPFLFGMDETGIMLGVGGKQKVVGASGQKIQHMKRDGNRELVTVMVTICADGTKLKEWIIFKGKNFQDRWLA